uniref:G-protein coupled receptors family 1 profile domain-containing protein n=1 Tax=Plectus sambesii TaxID=2011161 RepID=A0A914VDT3_9BILA
MTLRAVVRRHSNGSVLSVDNSRRSSRKGKPHKKVSTQSVLFMVGHDNSASNRRHTLCPHDDYEGLRQMSGHARLRKARNRTMQVSVTLILIYLCCWLPYNTLSWWRIIDPDSYAIVENTFYFLNGLVVLNSVFNPLIYGRTHLMDFPRRIMRKER